VEVVLLTADEARERRKAYLAREVDETGMTAAVDFFADAVFSGRMLGRYLPDEKAVYVIRDVLLLVSGGDQEAAEAKLFPVLAHELVHAYDDQVYGCVPVPSQLPELLEDPAAMGHIQTLMSLIEGRATYASELACAVAGVEPLLAPTVEQARSETFFRDDGTVGGQILAGLGNSVGRLKYVQYAYGRKFAKAVHDFGGEAFFGEVFSHLPLRFAELESFDTFLVRWAEDVEAAEESGEDASAGEGTERAVSETAP
jgi:hypothetical protein